VEMDVGTITVRLSDLEAEPTPLEARTLNVKTPGAVGVPFIKPVEVVSVSPRGTAPRAKFYVIGAVPVAIKTCA
jgi:hypothetical protein